MNRFLFIAIPCLVLSFFSVSRAQPDPATNPFPANNAVDVPANVILSWDQANGAEFYDLYVASFEPPIFVGALTDTFYDQPFDYDINLTYYWRVDTRNASGSTEGELWQFTTPDMAPQATNPFPADGATGVAIDAVLSWSPSPGAWWYDLSFGTTNPPPYVGFQAETTYTPGTLGENLTYYWQVNPGSSGGSTEGEIWSFTTIGGAPPEPAVNPQPAHEAVNVPLNSTLSWDESANADFYEIHFGASGETPLIDTVFTPAFDPGLLEYSTLYEWRVHAINDYGNARGMDWEFTTEIESPADELPVVPLTTTLGQPFPNPFNAETTIPFSIAASQHVTLSIYDITGREITKLS
ncbi:T9SS type A sorting domain-containing protein, partial [bacterium]|nr:T9SS type A sorting domain-containing protein [bacterium]